MKPLPPPDDALTHPDAVEVLRGCRDFCEDPGSLLENLEKPYPGLTGSVGLRFSDGGGQGSKD
jgi:hypothetical protein